ncbi:hypothetical protein DPMN_131492 [Dreissena polymorpha]|uniref:Uncharacterized protein n=1 Tax=Dreissena polymorpha TaxID=45954 RepID=A0A9D4H9M8_DREPO|nr:hypothetical protein DPMN_131492 [Dreissena polymorpha]
MIIAADDICRRVLARAHKKIVKEMNPQPVLEKLRDKGFLSHPDYIDIGVLHAFTNPG